MTPHTVLDFWLGDGLALGWPSDKRSKLWFGGGPELDGQITHLFGGAVRQALAGELLAWAHEPLGRLALVILLDQFTRNVFRGQALAFSGDCQAQNLVKQALDVTIDHHLPWVGRSFLYMPLMHAENLALQEEAVRRFGLMQAEAPPEIRNSIEAQLKSALEHRDIIAQFGRFPYRNKVLGRPNSPAEDEFLRSGPRFGQ
jgi:uncharacterized protein (DUF924 family)